MSAAAAKGINCESHIIVNGGRTTVLTTGNGTFDTDDQEAKGAAGIKADSTFTINKGSANSDVAAGDPVITSSGCVVGLVRTVSASSSVCVSLIDTTFAASVDLENVTGSCSAVGDYALMRQGKLMVEYISDSNRVFNGDSVITSGKGGLFPADLLIGYVDEVTATSDGQNDVAVVTPAVSLDDLLYVYVITDFSMKE